MIYIILRAKKCPSYSGILVVKVDFVFYILIIINTRSSLSQFPNLIPNLGIVIFLAQKRRSTFCEAQKLWKGRSGTTLHPFASHFVLSLIA